MRTEFGPSSLTQRLLYFPCRGRAELTRLLFAYGGMPYEDVRIPLADWRAEGGAKTTAPFSQLPVLEVSIQRKSII